MLVLSRKLGEKLIIGEDVVITVLSLDGDKIKLGIEAPKTVQVYRKELFDAIVEENKLASEIGSNQFSDLKHLVEETETNSRPKSTKT